MPAVNRVAPRAAVVTVVALVAAVVLAATAPTARAGGGSGGQCTVSEGGQWITVQCGYGGGTGGTGGSGGTGSSGGAIQTTCTFTPIPEADAKTLGLAWPPPKGMAWELMNCGLRGSYLTDPGAGPVAILVDTTTGTPAVTPQQLLQRALSELEIPALQPHTAPPLGRDGLVGLPEWFWVAASAWHQLSVTVRAGPVWATAMAMPELLTFQPGGGLSAVSCAGPGEPYDQALSAAGQHTRCSYTYEQPSASQPGHVYQAAVGVNWRIWWTGSGGTGGLLNPALSIPVAIALPVAQGEALVTTP
jgi:hypothetical protein